MDKYTIIKPIGEGAQSQTFLAKHNAKGTTVVLKRMATGSLSTREMHLMMKIKHPNIVPCYETFKHDSNVYLVLMFAEGGDLESVFKKEDSGKNIPLKTVLTWFVQCCKACQYCHENRVLHRDIKLANILLSKDRNVAYLGDFGVAKDFGADSGNTPRKGATMAPAQVTTTLVGSPAGYSPEVMSGTPYSYMSDVWSLGCVLYELVCKKHPFEADSFAQLVTKVCAGQFSPIPKSVPKEVSSVIQGMLNVDEKERLQIPEVTMTLKNYLRSIPGETGPGVLSAANSMSSEQGGPGGNNSRAAAAANVSSLSVESFSSAAISAAAVNDDDDDDDAPEESIDSWIKAKYHQIRSIDNYLKQFREEDNDLLKKVGGGNNNAAPSSRPGTGELNANRAKRMLDSPAKEAPPKRVSAAAAAPAKRSSTPPSKSPPVAAGHAAGAGLQVPKPTHRRSSSDEQFSNNPKAAKAQEEKAKEEAKAKAAEERRAMLKQRMEEGRQQMKGNNEGGNGGGGVVMAKAPPAPMFRKGVAKETPSPPPPPSGPSDPHPRRPSSSGGKAGGGGAAPLANRPHPAPLVPQKSDNLSGTYGSSSGEKKSSPYVLPNKEANSPQKGGPAPDRQRQRDFASPPNNPSKQLAMVDNNNNNNNNNKKDAADPAAKNQPTAQPSRDHKAEREKLREMMKEQRAKAQQANGGGNVEIVLPANLRKLPQNQM